MNSKMMKQTLGLVTLALLTVASASAAGESTVNPQITDSVTQTIVKIVGDGPAPSMVSLQARSAVDILTNNELAQALAELKAAVGQSDTPDTLMKIANSDVPDNMLSLLTALRSQNQKLGIRTAEQDEVSALSAEARAFIDYVKAGNSVEEGDMEALREVVLNSI